MVSVMEERCYEEHELIDKSLPKFLRCELWTYKAIFTQHTNPEIMKLSGVYLKMMWTVQQFQIISYL